MPRGIVILSLQFASPCNPTNVPDSLHKPGLLGFLLAEAHTPLLSTEPGSFLVSAEVRDPIDSSTILASPILSHLS